MFKLFNKRLIQHQITKLSARTSKLLAGQVFDRIALDIWYSEFVFKKITDYATQNAVASFGELVTINNDYVPGGNVLIPEEGVTFFKYKNVYLSLQSKVSYGSKDTPPKSAIVTYLKRDRKVVEELFVELLDLDSSVNISLIVERYDRLTTKKAGSVPEWVGLEKPVIPEDQYAQLDEIVQRFVGGRDNYVNRPYKETILLSGPPGTGKTSLGRHFSSKYKIPVSIITSGCFRGPVNINPDVPTIIIFDDIDRVEALRIPEGPSDGRISRNDLTTLTNVLNWLDGPVYLDNVLIFITANNPEMLYPAVIRPSRIDSKFHIAYMGLDLFYAHVGWGEDQITLRQTFEANYDTAKIVAGTIRSFKNCNTVTDVLNAIEQLKLVESTELF